MRGRPRHRVPPYWWGGGFLGGRILICQVSGRLADYIFQRPRPIPLTLSRGLLFLRQPRPNVRPGFH
jgi:hypothetical protein